MGAWDHGDTIYLCVGGIYDQWFNHLPDSCWMYYADFEPPMAWCIAEHDTNQDIEDFDTVMVYLYDDVSGVHPDSIWFTISVHNDNGDTAIYDYDINWEPALNYSVEESLLYIDLTHLSGFDMQRGDSLYFYLITTDQTTICDPNVFDDYLCVRYVKPITRCWASPQPFTPPPPWDGYNDEVIFDLSLIHI